LKSDAKSVLVSGTDRKSATLVQSLRKVLETDGVSDVSVVQRSNDVYITRK
jgi:methylmalonyl-CoA mutase cobalamin-binding subunit